MRAVSTTFLVPLLASAPFWAASPEQRSPASATAGVHTSFELASTTIRALSLADSARNSLTTLKGVGEPIRDSMNAIMAERSAANRLKDAALLLRQFDAAEDQRVKESASQMQGICETLAATLLADVGIWEKLARAKSADDISALVPESAKSASDMNEAWRLLPLGVAAITHALVDADRPTNGKLSHLRLTRAERAK